MSPKFLWLTEAVETLTFFIIQPMIGITIAYRHGEENRKRSAVMGLRALHPE